MEYISSTLCQVQSAVAIKIWLKILNSTSIITAIVNWYVRSRSHNRSLSKHLLHMTYEYQ